MARTTQGLDHDTLFLIAVELLTSTNSLRNLASSSRSLRQLCTPVLFQSISLDTCAEERIPPYAIRPYVRCLNYVEHHGSHGFIQHHFRRNGDIAAFGVELAHLPNLESVQLRNVQGGVPWTALKRCLTCPQVKSVAMDALSAFTIIVPYPRHDALPIRCTLTRFSYTMTLWREVPQYLDRHATIEDLQALEQRCLPTIVLNMHETAEALVLPMETASLARMAKLAWPRLRELSLSGQYYDATQLNQLPTLLLRMPELRKLTVTAAQRTSQFVRAPVYGRRPPALPYSTGLQQLSLVYPDPDDFVFSLPAAGMIHLSLRDCPRYYERVSSAQYQFISLHPTLSASECLSVLQRMGAMPHLKSLELVYKVDDVDEDLLRFIVSSYPTVRDLELHRYRADATPVDYMHIAGLMRSLPFLRILRLNLDFVEDCGAYCMDAEARGDWWELLTERIGWEVVGAVEACPLLEHVGMLYHGNPHSMWVEFHSARYAAPRIKYAYFSERYQDNEPPSWLWSLP